MDPMVKNVVVSVLNREKSIHGAQKQSDFQVKTIGIPTGPIAPQVKQLQGRSILTSSFIEIQPQLWKILH